MTKHQKEQISMAITSAECAIKNIPVTKQSSKSVFKELEENICDVLDGKIHYEITI